MSALIYLASVAAMVANSLFGDTQTTIVLAALHISTVIIMTRGGAA